MNEPMTPNRTDWRTNLLEQHPWATFVLPFLVYMLVGALDPTPTTPGGQSLGLAIPYAAYPWLYTAKIGLTMATVIFLWPGFRQFRLRITPLAIVVGIVGGPLWIGICSLQWEHAYLVPLLDRCGLGGLLGGADRPAFNPFEQLAAQPAAAWTFLAVRFLGLVAVVPLIEEFFLRGFLMRFVMERDWWKVPFGKADKMAILLGTAVPMLTHPAELLAAAVWFSMITWLMLKTRSIWDCVAAHSLTNLILGLYVVTTGTWRLM
jgi:hypothetical protein